MIKASYKVVRTTRSQQHRKQICKHISRDSFQNAEKVILEINVAVMKAGTNPEYYCPDKYRKTNDGRFRALKKTPVPGCLPLFKNNIRVLRVHHTSREPKFY